MIDRKIGIIGCGNMGEALISHLSKAVKNRLVVNDIDTTKTKNMAAKYKVSVADNKSLAEISDVLILAVKPKDFDSLLSEIAVNLAGNKILISIAAGITTKYIEKAVGKKIAVVRVMPNMPAIIGEAISSVSAGKWAKRKDILCAKEIFSAIGDVVEIDEKMVDSVTAISGSGPAYFFYLIESLIETAVDLGLEEKIAKKLAVKTALGSAKLLHILKEHPSILRAKVTSKGGTTEAAFKIFESREFKNIVKEAVRQAHNRSKELSRG